jgi:hypothetical protein
LLGNATLGPYTGRLLGSARYLLIVLRSKPVRRLIGPDTQSLPFQFYDFIHICPPEHIRPSSESRIGPTVHPQWVADFSTGVMGIFAPALTLIAIHRPTIP